MMRMSWQITFTARYATLGISTKLPEPSRSSYPSDSQPTTEVRMTCGRSLQKTVLTNLRVKGNRGRRAYIGLQDALDEFQCCVVVLRLYRCGAIPWHVQLETTHVGVICRKDNADVCCDACNDQPLNFQVL